MKHFIETETIIELKNKPKTNTDSQDLKKYKIWVKDKYLEWNSDINKYEDKVANWEISPKSLLEIWQNKDSNTELEYLPQIPFSFNIKNGPNNREPNWENGVKRKSKTAYFIGAVCYVRDYNVLPISMIINEQGQKEFNYLLAKDRGTFNFYFTKLDTKQDVAFWNKILIELEDFSHKRKIQAVIERIKTLTSSLKEFSAREAIPTEIFNEWFNDCAVISIRMKFERYDSYCGETRRLQLNDNNWVEHNHIMCDSVVPLVVKNPSTYFESTIEDIYSAAKVEPLFMGNHPYCMTNIPNASSEEYECFVPWLFTSLTTKYSIKDCISVIARSTDKNLSIKMNAYAEAFKKGKKVFVDDINLMIKIANNTSTKSFYDEHNIFLSKKYAGVNKQFQSKNLLDLSIKKWDTFYSVAAAIKNIISVVHKDRTGIDRINDITRLFFNNAIKLLSDDNVIKKLENANGGLSYRWDEFWNVVMDSTINDKKSELEGNINVESLMSIMADYFANKGFSTTNCYVYDRVSATEFVKVDLFDTTNSNNGHLNPNNPLKYGNVIRQLKNDNLYVDNRPISNLQSYKEEYLQNLNDFLNNNPSERDYLSYCKTEIYLDSLEIQKKYNS